MSKIYKETLYVAFGVDEHYIRALIFQLFNIFNCSQTK